MSILFGLQRNDEAKVDDEQLLALSVATERYAPDGTFVQGGMRVGMGFQPNHTHQRSKLEAQPAVDFRANRLTFDGRLDNYRELAALLNLPADSSDSSVVLASFERWGEECFAKLIGDWALALWSANECAALYLARDHGGTRSLYFEQTDKCLMWSTFLETFFASGGERTLDETYLVQYLSCQPLEGRTPYAGIRMVPAAHYLKFRNGGITRVAHWQWMVKETIHYETDTEYEEHFFSLFLQSVERRTGAGGPILAQLSGGMDSSSIVCMSDYIRSGHRMDRSDLIDTISFYDDREPELDEMPFVCAVERQRGREGIHVESSHAERTFLAVDSSEARYLLPGADSSSPGREQRFSEALGSPKYRVMLSGTGGDEVMGGVPTPLPELGDYLVSGAVKRLLKKGVAWCLPKRQPLVLMLWDTIQYLSLIYGSSTDVVASCPDWVDRTRLGAGALATYSKASFFHPSRIENGRTWWLIQETLPHLYPSYIKRYEYRYPFLDRDLNDFLFRIPREQLLRPGQKRSLQRRSLKALLPDEVFNRSRKAFASRGVSLALRSFEADLNLVLASSVAIERGVVKRYPLVIQMYTFHEGEFLTDGMAPTAMPARAIASAGMFYLQAAKKPRHTWDQQEAQDHLDGVLSAIDTLDAQGLIDPHKVGVIGFSFTSWYVENELVKAPERFAAATIAEGADNSYSQYIFWGIANPQLRKQMEAINGGQPFGKSLTKWMTNAPAFHLDQVKAPVRIEAMTPGSLLGEWEIYSSLRLQDKPVDLIYYPAGQHQLQRPLERLTSAQGNVDWFRFWLQGYEDPDPAKWKQYARWERMRQLSQPRTP